MKPDSSTNNTGQISRLFQTELVSSEECGVYITNIEIYEIAKEMGFDITLTSNEFIVGEIFKVASDVNRLKELYERIFSIFESRIAEYTQIQSLYPNASQPVQVWIDKAQKTMSKIQNSIKELSE